MAILDRPTERRFSPNFGIQGDYWMGSQNEQDHIAGCDDQQPPVIGGDPPHCESAPPYDDEGRFQAAKAGVRTALGELLDECRNYLLLIANRELGEGIQAKIGASDLVQETFVEAQKIFLRFEGNSVQELRLWLAKILEFKIAQASRRFVGTEMRDARREVPLDVRSDGIWPASWLKREQTATHLEEEDGKLAALRDALKRLPPAYRLAIQMRNFDQRSFAELAAKLERSTDAARRLWLRAVVRLRRELTGMSKPEQPGLADNEQRPIDSVR
jgi:RNA polymerase sigma-70 factor (ECF subfamily)